MSWAFDIQFFLKRGVILVAVLLLCSCGKPAKITDLSGEWIAHFPYGTESLSLLTNNHYLHSFTFTNGNTIHSDGEWDYSETKGELAGNLVLKNIQIVHDLDFEKPATKPTNGFWQLNVIDYGEGQIILSMDSDRAHFFERAPRK